MKVVGVDGCRGGWVAMTWDTVKASISSAVYPSLQEVLAANEDAAAIAVDIPIGLVKGPRGCDLAARKVLGPRRSSVFPAPDPRIIESVTHDDASALAKELTGKGVSQQAFAIFGKIAEANAMVTPCIQDRVFEVHPEVSFWALSGAPMAHPKGGQTGYDERRELLERAMGVTLPCREDAFKWKRPAKPDDILDAIVAAWTAKRVVDGEAGRLPVASEMNSQGLRVEIVY